MTTKTEGRSRARRKPPAPPSSSSSSEAVREGMVLVLTTGRAAEVDGRITAWEAGDELVVGVDVDVDEAIRMLNAELVEAKVDPPARSAGERR